MGNEMGNNNTSGLREEDNTTVEAQGKPLQEPIDANGVKEENHVVPTEETEATGFASGDPKGSGDTDDHKHLSDETELKPAESPKAEKKSDVVGDEVIEVQSASLPHELQGHEETTESNSELQGAGSNQLENQASFNEEEEEIMSHSTYVATSPSHDLEPQDSKQLKFDTESRGDQSVQNSNNSPKPSEDALGSSLCTAMGNGHLLDACISDNLDGILVSGTNRDVEAKKDDLVVKETASQGDKMPGEEKFQVELLENDARNDSIMRTTIPSGSPSDCGEKSGEELTIEMNCDGNNCLESQIEANLTSDPLNSQIELSAPEDKCVVLSEDTKFMRTESGEEVNECHNNEQVSDYCSQHHASNGHCQAEEAKAADRGYRTGFCSASQSKTSEDNSKESDVVAVEDASNGDCQAEEAKVAEHGYRTDFRNGSQSKTSEDNPKDSKAVAVEHAMLPAELSISNGHSKEEELHRKPEEEKPTEKQIDAETKEKPEASCANGKDMEAYPPQAPASPFQSQHNQQKTEMGSEEGQGSIESIPKLKSESCRDFLVTMASIDQETSMNVELAIEQPRLEDPYYVIAAPEMVTETRSSAFANQPSEQCAKVEKPAIARGDYEAQDSVGRPSSEAIPENWIIHSQMRKSPSFDLDLRIEARSEESDQTPLLYEDKTAIENLSNQAEISPQSPPLLSHYNQESLQYQTMAVEEKAIKLERSDSEKSRTPFLGFLKEDEEANVVIPVKKQDNNIAAAKKASKDLWNSPTKEMASTLPKGKKHKRRTSLFGTCMCCGTVIN